MIRDIRANSSINGEKFLIDKVIQGVTTQGSTYLTLILKDNTGIIEGRVWNCQSQDIEKLKSGKVIAISGQTIEFRDVLQLKIDKYFIIEDKDINWNDFIICPPISKEQMWEEIQYFINEIKHSVWKEIVIEILKKEKERFMVVPAATRNHHNIRSGLMWHTLTMLKTAQAISKVYSDRKINLSLLYAGIILHDMGKTKELLGDIVVDYGYEGKLIGHISIMAAEIMVVSKTLNLDETAAILLQHMVLASHGKKDFGSPVLPQIIEAEILHFIDNLDARIYAIDTILTDIDSNEFSQRLSGLEGRSFYKHNIKDNENK